ncbi:PH domain-like protein [Phytophthora cinnamomi]|uniref:PH domain-like protein n=1 Tax=Phytophthora cinnamomi TaxID=4785 RepID=UPI003559726B|nr:PH domain-like protein [Phytophthora cinnamomi]
MADRMDAKLVASSPSNKPSSSGTANFRAEEIRGYLFKKTREGKWQKRWFETNGCFLTYYKKQGQKLLAALNLPQVGAITLLQEDHVDGPGLFTIELNERVYTIKARSHDEAAFWVDALLWRQAGGVVTQKSPDVTKQKVGTIAAVPADQLDSVRSSDLSSATTSTTSSMHVEMASKQRVDVKAANPDDVGKDGAPCAACCVVQ